MKNTRFAGLVWPTLVTLAALATLVALGTWQLQRKGWKDALIAHLKERATAEPVSLQQALAVWQASGDVEYLRVRLRGKPIQGGEARLYAIDRGKIGWHVITPIEVADGTAVFVNRGFRSEPADEALPPAEVEVVGLARVPAEPPWFTPTNSPAKNMWFSLDLPALAASLGIGPQTPLAPFVIEAEAGSQPAAGAPKAGVTRLTLPNRHLEYAITWYGLALALAGVYAAFVWKHIGSSRAFPGTSTPATKQGVERPGQST